VINRGGEKIYPREIEDFLLTQPGVRAAAVVGARDEVLGELPVAYVVPVGPAHPGQPPDARLEGTRVEEARLEEARLEEARLEEARLEEARLEGARLEGARLEGALRAACEAALPRPKRPTAFHLVAELPLGPTGKLARKRLTEPTEPTKLTEPTEPTVPRQVPVPPTAA
jgi:oxalate---CoA ligase